MSATFGDLVGRERVEHDDPIEPVDELGPERGEHRVAVAAVEHGVIALGGARARADAFASRVPRFEVRTMIELWK